MENLKETIRIYQQVDKLPDSAKLLLAKSIMQDIIPKTKPKRDKKSKTKPKKNHKIKHRIKRMFRQSAVLETHIINILKGSTSMKADEIYQELKNKGLYNRTKNALYPHLNRLNRHNPHIKKTVERNISEYQYVERL